MSSRPAIQFRRDPVLPAAGRGAPPGSDQWEQPWVQMKYFSYHPAVYPNMVSAWSHGAKPGALIHVYDRDGQPFGTGFFNQRAKVAVRMLGHGATPVTEEDLDARIARAIRLRRETQKLDETTNAYRLIFSDGDGISGLSVDKYANILSIEVTSLGAWRRLSRWLPIMHELAGTDKHVIRFDEEIARMEGMKLFDVPEYEDEAPSTVRITEHGIDYEVNFVDGHKTGFFCDQRENRRRFGQLAAGRRVLDLCSYTGGFALAAKVIGKCGDVTAVDLDEKAIEQGKRNTTLNRTRIRWVQSDTFTWARDVAENQQTWEAVVLDPPKMLFSREGDEAFKQRNKYSDMNTLALKLVSPGGLFVTCSCSGLLSAEEFEEIVCRAAHRNGRKLQILDRTGAGMDHPMMSNCPESRYLKVIWAIVH